MEILGRKRAKFYFINLEVLEYTYIIDKYNSNSYARYISVTLYMT